MKALKHCVATYFTTVAALVLVGAACESNNLAVPKSSERDPFLKFNTCKNISCSGHGECDLSDSNLAICNCFAGYRVQELACVPIQQTTGRRGILKIHQSSNPSSAVAGLEVFEGAGPIQGCSKAQLSACTVTSCPSNAQTWTPLDMGEISSSGDLITGDRTFSYDTNARPPRYLAPAGNADLWWDHENPTPISFSATGTADGVAPFVLTQTPPIYPIITTQPDILGEGLTLTSSDSLTVNWTQGTGTMIITLRAEDSIGKTNSTLECPFSASLMSGTIPESDIKGLNDKNDDGVIWFDAFTITTKTENPASEGNFEFRSKLTSQAVRQSDLASISSIKFKIEN